MATIEWNDGCAVNNGTVTTVGGLIVCECDRFQQDTEFWGLACAATCPHIDQALASAQRERNASRPSIFDPAPQGHGDATPAPETGSGSASEPPRSRRLDVE
jgi:hypothetical protein